MDLKGKTKEDIHTIMKSSLDDLANQLEEGKSDELVRFMEIMSRFHHYSYFNQLMILIQRPDAAKVSGLRNWNKLGRKVKKGSRAIKIWAPVFGGKYHYHSEDKKTGEVIDEDRRFLTGFKIVNVFDIADTEGDELPDVRRPIGDAGAYYNHLKDFASTKSIKIEFEDLGDVRFSPGGMSTKGTVIINSELDDSSKFSVLAHEIAHEMIHWDTELKLSRDQKELEAEAVSFIASRYAGLDSNQSHSDYIKIYRGDREALEQSMSRIFIASKEILKGLENGTRSEDGSE